VARKGSPKTFFDNEARNMRLTPIPQHKPTAARVEKERRRATTRGVPHSPLLGWGKCGVLNIRSRFIKKPHGGGGRQKGGRRGEAQATP